MQVRVGVCSGEFEAEGVEEEGRRGLAAKDEGGLDCLLLLRLGLMMVEA